MSLAAFEPTWQNERKGYIRCRAIGHSWVDYDSSNWKPQFGTPLTLRCERCGMERRDALSLTGQLMHRSYFRPDHYQLSREEAHPTRDDFRVMLLALRGDLALPTRGRKKAAS